MYLRWRAVMVGETQKGLLKFKASPQSSHSYYDYYFYCCFLHPDSFNFTLLADRPNYISAAYLLRIDLAVFGAFFVFKLDVSMYIFVYI